MTLGKPPPPFWPQLFNLLDEAAGPVGARHSLGGSKAEVQGRSPTFSHWLALLSPAGRNILNSVKNNKHG